jgi:hypothetical protein
LHKYGELLIGDRGSRTKLLAEYKMMRQAALVANPEVVEFVTHHKINDRGIGWIDADRPLGVVAQDIGVAYPP